MLRISVYPERKSSFLPGLAESGDSQAGMIVAASSL
jgi:hypothetical protein